MADENDIIGSVINSVRVFLRANDICGNNLRIVVGVSGGLDSIALLDILNELSDECGFTVIAAHLNHAIRTDAGSDENFCRDLCDKLGVEFYSQRADVPKYALDNALSTEQAGRTLRYDFLKDVCSRRSARFLATAHHRGDNVETFLHHLFRGTHLRGAGGISPVRKFDSSDVTLIRPLLCCDKAQLAEYCRTKNLEWREDSTNLDTDYTRNFIRHELMGIVTERINPKAAQAVARFINAVRNADEFIESQAQEIIQAVTLRRDHDMIALDAILLAAQPPIIRGYVCRAALMTLNLPMRSVGFEDIESIASLADAAHTSIINLPCGGSARRDRDSVVIRLKSTIKNFKPIELAPNGTVEIQGRKITCAISDFDENIKKQFAQRKLQGNCGFQWMDADKLRGKIIIRQRQDGDRFNPLGRTGKKLVSDFLTDLKLTSHRRDEIVCICDENGILCIDRFRIDERVKISDSTRRVLIMEIN